MEPKLISLKPRPLKVIGIDFGLKRMGLAISNDLKTMALPWTTVTGGEKSLIAAIESRKSEISTIVMGLPLLMNGTKGDMALKVEAFAKILEKHFGISIVLLDERLSSKHADAALRETGRNRKQRNAKTDETAASFLLQTYLNSLDQI